MSTHEIDREASEGGIATTSGVPAPAAGGTAAASLAATTPRDGTAMASPRAATSGAASTNAPAPISLSALLGEDGGAGASCAADGTCD